MAAAIHPWWALCGGFARCAQDFCDRLLQIITILTNAHLAEDLVFWKGFTMSTFCIF
jgi:hypothetical protein